MNEWHNLAHDIRAAAKDKIMALLAGMSEVTLKVFEKCKFSVYTHGNLNRWKSANTLIGRNTATTAHSIPVLLTAKRIP